MGQIIRLEQIEQLSKKIKQQGNKIILVGGCFDILHIGHIEFLEKSKNLGGTLVVLLESDESIKQLKGINRPINKQEERAVILSKISMVDFIVPLPLLTKNEEYFTLVKKIKPDIIAITAGDQKKKEKKIQAEEVKGELVEVMQEKGDYSTTKIIENIKNYKTD